MNEIVVERSAYYPASLAARLVSAIISIVEALLAIRVILEMLGANSQAGFVAWMYETTAGLVGPFNGAFPNIALGPGAVIDLSAIFAMIGYALLGWIILRVMAFVSASL